MTKMLPPTVLATRMTTSGMNSHPQYDLTAFEQLCKLTPQPAVSLK